jgi:trans-2,3-dihydro-3-hydroxyanthranilate isomerase
MRFRFLTADVFTDQPFGGNALAVFPDARDLPEARFQQVAREINYSETVFVLPPADPAHTRRLRIFTPGAEVPFAGHPTVGTAFVLASIGEVPVTGDETRIVFEEGIGPVAVTIHSREGRPIGAELSAARMPERGPQPPDLDELATLLSLAPRDLVADDLAAETWTSGVPFLVIPVRDREALGRAELDMTLWRRLLAEWWAPSVYVVARSPEPLESGFKRPDWRVRMFAPGLGVPEDPATGAAATAFAGYLGRRAPESDGTLRWVLEQGIEMGRPSLLRVEADKRDGEVVAVRVGGGAVLMAEGEMEIQP